MNRTIDRAVERLWDNVLDDLWDIVYDNGIAPDNGEFKRAVEVWLGDGAYEAFIDSWDGEEL